MSGSGLTIWCNAELPPEARRMLIEGADGQRLIFAVERDVLPGGDSAAAAKETDTLAEADVAFGQPDPEQVMRCANVRWVHLTSASYTAYDRDDFRASLRQRNGALTNSSAVYDEPCAQHVLAMILALARQLPAALDAQRTTRDWAQEEIRKRSTLLGGQTALILGYGRIARRLSELLLPLRLELIGVRRQVRGDEPIRVVTEREVSAILPLADHIINILPASDGTRDFLDAERLGIAKPGAILYNIGRGTTVNQDALIGALQSGRLSAAYLDVTDPEPLPPDHPLWSAPNCYITPHTAGGHTVEFERLVRHFLNNLRRYAAGDALIDRII